MNKLLSFCCVSYNHAPYIRECIDSICNNDYKNIEILILDDGSKDNSEDVIKEIESNCPYPIKIIFQQNSGNVGANFNKLINLAKGEFISIIACDDKLYPNSLKNKMDKLNAEDNLAFICHSKIQAIDENSNYTNSVPKLELENYSNPTVDDLLELDYKELNAYYIQGGIYRKSIVEAIKGFDEDMICDDIVFRTKLHRYIKEHNEFTFNVSDSIGVCYRRHSGNVSSNSARQIKSTIQYLGKYWANRPLPDRVLAWLKHSVYSTDDFSEIFITDKYIKSAFNKINHSILKPLVFPGEIPYKKVGIPFIFEILSYKAKGKKIKSLKIFGLEFKRRGIKFE